MGERPWAILTHGLFISSLSPSPFDACLREAASAKAGERVGVRVSCE